MTFLKLVNFVWIIKISTIIDCILVKWIDAVYDYHISDLYTEQTEY